jgi:hypothetical protein
MSERGWRIGLAAGLLSLTARPALAQAGGNGPWLDFGMFVVLAAGALIAVCKSSRRV